MIVQAGRAALSLALALAVYGAVAAILAVRLRRPALVESARRASQAILALTSLAVLAMALLLLRRDYQVLYVYEHVNSSLSSLYAAAALWAGPEGSLLLWLWLLSLFAFLIGHQKAPWARDLEPYALAVISFTQGFFALLLCSVNRPFVLLPARAIEGSGLNPLLENPAMIFHPPALFAGYAAYTVPFAYAVAALASGRLDGQWLRGVRRWNLLAWGLLGLGILLGAQWAYVELGWGGYWAWDPVENASLIPWLTGTALLHSAMVQERRGLFKVWNLLLVIATFLFCILGTLIARSGFVTGSLHTFAPSPVGNLLQAYIVLASLVCLWLLVRRRHQLQSAEALPQVISREGVLLLNNLLLTGLALAILLGTLFPVLTEALLGMPIALGRPFFEHLGRPLALVLLLLLGICPLLGWRRPGNLGLALPVPLAAGVLTGLGLMAARPGDGLAPVAFGLIAMVAAGIAQEFARGIRARQRVSRELPWVALAGLFRTSRRRYGGYLVHLAVVLMALGIVGEGLYGSEHEATLKRGEAVAVGRYQVRFEALSSEMLATRDRHVATVGVYVGDQRVMTLRPEYNYHHSVRSYVAEVALRSTLREDLYVAIVGIAEDASAVSFRVLLNPLMLWLWIGGGLLLFGTLVALWPEGSRVALVTLEAQRRRA